MEMVGGIKRDFFYFGICHLCKAESDHLKRCSSCKTVAYCTREHQKADWNNHKQLCNVMISFKKKSVPSISSFDDWTNYRLSCLKYWESSLNRELQPCESQMWMFPRVCNVCYTSEGLTDCLKCKNVAYCSEEHKEQDKDRHMFYCHSLRLAMDIDKYLGCNECYPEFEMKQQIFTQSFPKDIEELIDVIQRQNIDNKLTLEHILKSDLLSPGATILYTIKISGIEQSLNERLIIHVVGSSVAEATADWKIATELLFHWIPNLKEIMYIFIGPEVWDVALYDFDLCSACKDNQKRYTIKTYKSLYHNINDEIEVPSLVISFNSGLHEFEGQDCDQWQRSIPLLLKNSFIPFVFTSYTEEEMVRDLQRINDCYDKTVQIVFCGKNPFASLRPIRDWNTENVPIFYCSNYIGIIRKQQRK